MKKMMSVLLCTVLVMLISFPLFANGKKESSSEKEVVNLIWYVPGGSGFPYGVEDEKEVYAQLNSMLERDLGITVDIKATGKFGEYRETMPLAMAAGEKFDIVWTASWCNNFMDAASDGYYAGLDELLPQYAPTIWKDTKDALNATRVNGEIRGVWSQQIAAMTSNFFLLQSMIDKYGWDVSKIKKVEDLEPILADIKAGDPDMVPLSMRYPIAEWMKFSQGYAALGILTDLLALRIDDESCKIVNVIKEPGYIKNIELARKWHAEGYVPKDGLTYNNDQWTQMVNSGKIAIKLHNTWKPGLDRIATAFGDTWVQIPFEGPSVMQGANIISTLNAVSSRSEHKEEAVQLLEYIWTNAEAYNLLTWGIEGKHYTKDSDGYITTKQDGGYFTNLPWVFGNTFISHLQKGDNPEANALIYKLNQDAVKSPLMGFSLDMDPIKTLIASVSAVKDQYQAAVAGGYTGDKDYKEYLDALEQAGIDELISGIQTQIDSWLAAK